jgi:hypothetical protein
MGDHIDNRKTEAFREAARARAALQWTPDARSAQSDLTREKMKAPGVSERIAAGTRSALAEPEVRQRHLANTRAAMARPDVRERVSAATKLGMERWRTGLLAALLEAWRRSPKGVREQFLLAIGARPADDKTSQNANIADGVSLPCSSRGNASIDPSTGKAYLAAQICAGTAEGRGTRRWLRYSSRL